MNIIEKLEKIGEGLEDYKSWWKAHKDSEIYKDYLDTNEIKEKGYSYVVMEGFGECLEILIEILEESSSWAFEELEEFIKAKMGLCREEAYLALEATLNGDIVFTCEELITLRNFVLRLDDLA